MPVCYWCLSSISRLFWAVDLIDPVWLHFYRWLLSLFTFNPACMYLPIYAKALKSTRSWYVIIVTHVHTYLKLTKSLLSLLQTPQSQVRVWVWWTGTKWSLMLSPGGRAPLLKLSLTTKCKVQRKIHFRRVGASSFMKLFPLVLSEELEKEIEKMDKNWVL